MNLANSIKHYRKEAGFTQQQLADKLKVTQTIVALWEGGSSSPTPKGMQRIAKALKVPVVAIILKSLELSDFTDDKDAKRCIRKLLSITKNANENGKRQKPTGEHILSSKKSKGK